VVRGTGAVYSDWRLFQIFWRDVQSTNGLVLGDHRPFSELAGINLLYLEAARDTLNVAFGLAVG